MFGKNVVVTRSVILGSIVGRIHKRDLESGFALSWKHVTADV